VPKLKTDGTVESTGFELLKTVPADAVFTDTVYAFTSNKKTGTNGLLTSTGGVCIWTFTHNLNTKDVVVSVRDTSNDEIILVEVKANNVNSVQVLFVSSTTISSGAYSITVIG
jgi:hypothetical protein